ncbi:hypothetical protein ACTXT7_001900 [Hymenolepis weldensis]
MKPVTSNKSTLLVTNSPGESIHRPPTLPPPFQFINLRVYTSSFTLLSNSCRSTPTVKTTGQLLSIATSCTCLEVQPAADKYN